MRAIVKGVVIGILGLAWLLSRRVRARRRQHTILRYTRICPV